MTKLEEKRKAYGIPEIPYLPMGRTILVFRIPSETKTEGGLFVPEEHAGPKRCGVLLAAGLAAREIMHDALIEIGDTVYFGRFEGDEDKVDREAGGVSRKLLTLKIDGVHGSVEAIDRARQYEIKPVVIDDKTGDSEFRYVEKTNNRRTA